MEAPYLQKLTKTLDPNKFIVLAVNQQAPHDPGVLTYFKYYNYSYLPLRSPSPEWAKANASMLATAPLTFILNANGQLIFHPDIQSKQEYHVALRGIQELIAAANRENPQQ